MHDGCSPLKLLAAAFLLLMSLTASHAQTIANVTVNAASPIATIPSIAVGVNTAVWDGLLLDSSVPSHLQSAGVTALRFPGGSTSDVYHWQTNSATAGTGQYINSADTFDAFMGVAQKTVASPILTVNYGSNIAGTAGGDPNEAAAWVDNYSNNTKHYSVRYWEIGNEVYGNGEYGGAWETDLHASHTPSTYGANVLQFIEAMKAKDPSIKVGVALTAPGNWPDGQTPDWNSNVLAACGQQIDFVTVHWYPQGPGSESDSYLLTSTNQISAMMAAVHTLILRYCGSNAANVQVLVTETNSVSYNPGKQTVSTVNALFLADNYMRWLENGASNIDWWDLHNGASTGNNDSASLFGDTDFGDYGILSSGSGPEPAADTPFAPYFGLQSIAKLGKSGDSMVVASTNQPLVCAHAVKQANGNLALMLINQDPANAYVANITVAGYYPAASATAYTYGMGSTSLSTSPVVAGVGFAQSVPPYSITTVVMTPGSAPSSPAFITKTSLSASRISPGGSITISSSFTDVGAPVSNTRIGIDVCQNGKIVTEHSRDNASFVTNETVIYNQGWTSGLTPGIYTVKLCVTNMAKTVTYYSNADADSFTVSAPDTAEFNFENGSQGWTTSGGMISLVDSTTANAYAGSHSLAVDFSGTGADTQNAEVYNTTVPAGSTVTFHVWFPVGSAITSIQPFALQGGGGGWTWSGNWQSTVNLQAGQWNTLTLAIPANAVNPMFQLGVQFTTSAAWTGTCYIDSVSW